MIVQIKSDPLAEIISRLNPDQQAVLEDSPRPNRLTLLSQFLDSNENKVLQEIGERCNLEIIEQFELHPDATDLIPLRLIHEYQCLPFVSSNKDAFCLITLWPPDASMDDWIYAVCGKRPNWHLGVPKNIINTITQKYGVGSSSLSDSGMDEDDHSGRDIEESEDENAAIIRFVNDIIRTAVEDRATDIHIEPLKDSLQIRYRIDGELVAIRVPDNLVQFQGAIISRIKIMAKLNISEKRRPQDGRINYRAGSSELDIRISTMPTMYGESVSLRLLNQKNQPMGFQELGLMPEDQAVIKKVLDLPHGIILVTGPTGAGKSTSLTAFIRDINKPENRIITIEDPVEYEVPGVNQIQVHPEIGLNFAGALRHVLRQDPDVIMVGEIRDRETAEIAIRAALTGHLVFSTLHTNDAPGALTRLIDMEIEPFLIASSVELIIAQRLVRCLCKVCKKTAQHDPEFLAKSLQSLQIEPTDQDLAATIYEPVGCENCHNLGYRGRIGIYENLRVNDVIHELIIQKQTPRLIRQQAIKSGMMTLQQAGWNQVLQGNTSLDEVMRVSKLGDDA